MNDGMETEHLGLTTSVERWSARLHQSPFKILLEANPSGFDLGSCRQCFRGWHQDGTKMAPLSLDGTTIVLSPR